MIDNAPRIQIAEGARRPSPEQVAALTGVATGYLVDALGGSGALDYRIKPVVPVCVATGDIVAGDQDGVVVVPFERIDACIERLERVRAAEAELDAKVKAGLKTIPWAR